MRNAELCETAYPGQWALVYMLRKFSVGQSAYISDPYYYADMAQGPLLDARSLSYVHVAFARACKGSEGIRG